MDNMTSTIGIMQALISVFIDDNDKLRCINAGNTRITFLIRSPLYYACASSWGEPESVVSLSLHVRLTRLQIKHLVCEARRELIWTICISKYSALSLLLNCGGYLKDGPISICGGFSMVSTFYDLVSDHSTFHSQARRPFSCPC